MQGEWGWVTTPVCVRDRDSRERHGLENSKLWRWGVRRLSWVAGGYSQQARAGFRQVGRTYAASRDDALDALPRPYRCHMGEEGEVGLSLSLALRHRPLTRSLRASHPLLSVRTVLAGTWSPSYGLPGVILTHWASGPSHDCQSHRRSACVARLHPLGSFGTRSVIHTKTLDCRTSTPNQNGTWPLRRLGLNPFVTILGLATETSLVAMIVLLCTSKKSHACSAAQLVRVFLCDEFVTVCSAEDLLRFVV